MSTETINREIQSLSPGALVTLYTIDATELGGGFWRFFPGTSKDNLSSSITYQGNVYDAYPMEVRGFDFTGRGAPPRPTLIFANIFGQLTSLVLQYDDLIGARVTRRRTYKRFLDGEPTASPLHYFPDDVFYIERKVSESIHGIEFELATSMEVDDIALPKRQIMANLCLWTYRGAECGFGGNYVVADINDVPLVGNPGPTEWNPATLYVVGSVVWQYAAPPMRRYYVCVKDNGSGIMGESFSPQNPTFWKADQCSKRVKGCELRFITDPRGLPFGGFPATARIGL